MRRLTLGDRVTLAEAEGVEGIVTGTMTLDPSVIGGEVKHSVFISWIVPRTVFVPSSWHPVEDVVLVEKAPR